MLEVSKELVSELDLGAALERVLSTAQELTGARSAALAILDERGQHVERFLKRDDAGTQASSYGFASGHPQMDSFLVVPILIGSKTWGNLYVTEKQSGRFTAGDEQALVELAEWAQIAIDNARRHEREASRRDQMERVVEALEASTTIARALGDETDLERVLELIVTRGRALVGARAMLLLLHDGEELLVHAEAGEITGSALGRRLALDGVSWRALALGTPLRIDDVALKAPSAEHVGVADARSAMVIPLVYRARRVGVLVAFDRLVDGPRFTAEDEALVPSFAASAAIAVATAQSVEREHLRQSIESAEGERRRWARELHDATLQSLGALAISLSSAQDAGDPVRLDRTVIEAVEQLRYEIAALRALITDLRPAELDDLGIIPALETLIDHSAELYDFAIEFDPDPDFGRGAARLVPEAETAIYRVVQESIRNAAKHAGASTVHVAIEESGGLIRGTIADDGQGFDPAADSAGFGLVGMKERVTLAGGHVRIRSGSHGTTVRFELAAVRRDPPPVAGRVIA